MPPGMDTCITLNEKLCEDCYDYFIQVENGKNEQSACTRNYLMYREETLKFELDKKFEGPYPQYPCHFHSQIQRAHYCPTYKCYLKQDVAKWTMGVETSSHLKNVSTTDTKIQQDDTTQDTGKGASWLAHAVTIRKPSKMTDHNNSLMLDDDGGSNNMLYPTASTKFSLGSTTYHQPNSSIRATMLRNVVVSSLSSSKISPTTASQKNIIVSTSAKINPTISQEKQQVHLSFPHHDSTVATTSRTHVPDELTHTISFQTTLSNMSVTPSTTFKRSSNIVSANATTHTSTTISNNSYATQLIVPVVAVVTPQSVTTELSLPSSPSVLLRFTTSVISSNDNLGMATEPHEINSDFLPSSSPKPPHTQHEQASTVATETWKNLMIHQLDNIDDWNTLVKFPQHKKHNLTSEQIMNVQLEDFLLTDDDKKDGVNEPSAASSIHHGAGNKRHDKYKNNFWWPNTKGWLSAGSIFILVALLIWVSSSSSSSGNECE